LEDKISTFLWHGRIALSCVWFFVAGVSMNVAAGDAAELERRRGLQSNDQNDALDSVEEYIKVGLAVTQAGLEANKDDMDYLDCAIEGMIAAGTMSHLGCQMFERWEDEGSEMSEVYSENTYLVTAERVQRWYAAVHDPAFSAAMSAAVRLRAGEDRAAEEGFHAAAMGRMQLLFVAAGVMEAPVDPAQD
jgi:hypothetical protein